MRKLKESLLYRMPFDERNFLEMYTSFQLENFIANTVASARFRLGEGSALPADATAEIYIKQTNNSLFEFHTVNELK